MRNFIITEDVLGAVAQCIGAATHGVPYAQVAGLIARLENLPQVQPGKPEAVKADGAEDPQKSAKGKGAEAPRAPQAKNV